MSIDYQTYVSQLSNLMVIGSTDAQFQIFLPGCIDYAEMRLYRELDLVDTQITDVSASTATNRNFTLPTNIGTYIVVDQVNVLSSAGTTSSNGVRNPVMPVSREYIDAVYPSGTVTTGVPTFYCRANSSTLIFGPAPDANYNVEVVGTQRPTPLSSGNSSTFLTAYLPDLFICASMIFASAYMRDFGSQADNPNQAQSWETQYGLLMKSASVEEVRKKYEAEGWTSQQPSPIATPPRV